MDSSIFLMIIILLLIFIFFIVYYYSYIKHNKYIINYSDNTNNTIYPLIGGCAGTRYGCCPDQQTPKHDNYGSNCQIHPPLIGGCASTRYGCCPDQQTPKHNINGSNC
jgi:hypothetical protein